MSAGENFKFIFREAKINDAILFFDECEAIFETRDKGGHDVNMLLTEIERYVCVCVCVRVTWVIICLWSLTLYREMVCVCGTVTSTCICL